MANPILIEVTRGALVESTHRGALVVSDGNGKPLMKVGDTSTLVFPRSAIKIIQTLPLLETGAADLYNFGAPGIALACGSHTGGERHVAVARAMMAALELGEECLACGAAEPQGSKARREWAANGGRPTAFHHNCSGKHAGMMAAAKAIHAPVKTYYEPTHIIQRDIAAAVAAMSGEDLTEDRCGLDGCSVPAWAMPLDKLATVFAKIGTGERMGTVRRAALARILDACWREPDLVAGPGRADTIVMAALPRRIFLKTGAEGTYCGSLPELGLGFALKIDDGAIRASAAAVMPLVEKLIPEARGLMKRSILKTPTGQEAGTIRISQEYAQSLATLRV